MSEAYRGGCYKPNKCKSCCTGCELLCLSIPCPINLQLLGGIVNLAIDIPCVRIGGANVANTGGGLGKYYSKFQSCMDKIGVHVDNLNCCD